MLTSFHRICPLFLFFLLLFPPLRSHPSSFSLFFLIIQIRNHNDVIKWTLKNGGHPRTGYEDNLMVKRGTIAKSNADLVRSIAALCPQYLLILFSISNQKQRKPKKNKANKQTNKQTTKETNKQKKKEVSDGFRSLVSPSHPPPLPLPKKMLLSLMIFRFGRHPASTEETRKILRL